MRKLILHIGFHKTGSTSIQRFLLQHRKVLSVAGWSLFCKRPDGTESVHGNANTWVSFNGKKHEFKAKLDTNLFSELSETSGNVILSCEEFAWFYKAEDIQSIFYSLSQIFDDIQVICYVRRQDKHLLSHYHQGFRYPHSSAKDFFGDIVCIMPEHQDYYRNYLDYNAKLAIWSSVFGAKKLYVREFSRAKFDDGNVVSDFLKTLNLNIDAVRQDEIDPVNESLNSVQTIVNYAVFSARQELWYELGRRKFTADPVFHSDNNPTLDQAASNAIMSNYFISNDKLKKYIPDLSSSWLLNETDIGGNISGFKTMPENEYKKAIVAVVKYYDTLSILGFVKIKYRRFLEQNGFKRNIR